MGYLRSARFSIEDGWPTRRGCVGGGRGRADGMRRRRELGRRRRRRRRRMRRAGQRLGRWPGPAPGDAVMVLDASREPRRRRAGDVRWGRLARVTGARADACRRRGVVRRSRTRGGGSTSLAAYWQERGFVARRWGGARPPVQVLVRLGFGGPTGGPALAYPADRVYRKRAPRACRPRPPAVAAAAAARRRRARTAARGRAPRGAVEPRA